MPPSKGSKSRKRQREESEYEEPESEPEPSDHDDEDYSGMVVPKKDVSSSALLLHMVETARQDGQQVDTPTSSKRRRRQGLSPIPLDPGEDVKPELNFCADRDTAYLSYDETWWNPSHQYRLPSDITLQRIHKSGGEGVGRVEVGHDLMMDTTTKAGNRRVSAYIVGVCDDKKGHIGQYQKMDGKIRSIKYFWKASNTPEKFQKLFEDFAKFSGVACPFKMGQVIKFPNCNLNTLRMSDVTLRRLNDLLEMLDQTPVIVTIHRALKYVEDKEKAAGYNFSIDKKSLLKCVKALEHEKLLHMYETSVCCDGATNKIQVICRKDIEDVEEPIVKEYIEKTIDQYHNEGRVFPHGQLRYSVKKRGELKTNEETPHICAERVLTSFDPNAALTIDHRFQIFRAMTARATVVKLEDPDETLNETSTVREEEEKEEAGEEEEKKEVPLLPPADPMDISLNASLLDDDVIPLPTPEQKRIVKMNTSMANLYGYQSKALRFATLHEVVYQLVYGHSPDTKPNFYEKFPLGTPLALWPFDENPHVYVDEEGPMRFIPPLPKFEGLQRGWFMLQDFIHALPLSVFVLCAYVPKEVDKVMLDEYLRDAIRRHTVIGDLPNELRLPIIRDKKLYRQIEHSLLCLAAMGLICVGQNPDPKRFVTAASAMFYVAKQGEIYDTSTSQRGYATISGTLGQYERHLHIFGTLEDVQRYWHHLRAITQSTPLSFRMDMNQDEAALQRHKKYSQGLIDKSAMIRNTDDPLDDIEPLGPRDGCAGFDASLFLHLRRHWDLNPRPSVYVTWFIQRFRATATAAQDFIAKRVAQLQADWNSFVKSMMPSDLDLTRSKKAIASSTTLYPSTRASIAIEPKSKTRLQSAKKSYEWRKKKRPLDSVDLVSQESRIHVRSRFNPREKDMLILIRAVGFFLNPVYRFWLDPAVLRDIMHDYVPESRSKTVQSLMAAGVREMVRPQRLAYLQRIVRNLTTFPEMRQLRFQLASQPVVTASNKTQFFKNAFDIANKLLFMDHQNMPHTSVSDADFNSFLQEGQFILSPEQTQSNPLPLRSRAPVLLPHIHHAVAVNVLLGILVHCHEGMNSEEVLGQLNATVIHNALQILRSDGLVSRTRSMDQNLMVITKNQAVLSYYFRHFFAHRFHPDIIEQTNLILRSFPPADEHPIFTYEGDHVGLIIAASNSFFSENDIEVEVDQEILNIFEEASREHAQQSTKQIRYLENADLHLERINVHHVLNADFLKVENASELVGILDKSQKKSLVEAATPTIFFKSFPDESLRSPMKKVFTAIRASGALGIKFEDIIAQTKLKKTTVDEIIRHFLAAHIILEVGVDAIRWIATEYRDAWCVEVNERILFPKPWTLPTGGICLSTVRWMAESCLFTIVANAGISMKDFHFRYEFALQPAAVTELVYLLEKAQCIQIKEEQFPSMEIVSPFDDYIPMITCTYLLPSVDCVERFARIFSDVTLLPSMVSGSRHEDDFAENVPENGPDVDDRTMNESVEGNDSKNVHLMTPTIADSLAGLL